MASMLKKRKTTKKAVAKKISKKGNTLEELKQIGLSMKKSKLNLSL